MKKNILLYMLMLAFSISCLTFTSARAEDGGQDGIDYTEQEMLENRIPEEITEMDQSGNISDGEDESAVVDGRVTPLSTEIQIVNFNTKGASATTSYTEVGTGEAGYVCGAYGADAAYLGTQNGKVRFMISGVIGEVSASEVQIINFSSAKSVSHYIVSGGKLLHKISTNLNNTTYASILDQGNAPSYLKEGAKYYSYDGHYFYSESSYSVMLEDYINGTRKNSINSGSPYFNYFQYLPLRSVSAYSGTELNSMINTRVESSSKMKDVGTIIVEMQNTYGTNALLMTGVAANESAWGTSSISQSKNNLFGMNAVDSSPGQSANYYSDVKACIKDFSETYMSKQYLNPQNWKYYGAFLGNKASGINVKYASDPYWGEKAANVAWTLDRAYGNKDAGTYRIGIKDLLSSDHTALNIRKEASATSTKLYNTGQQAFHAFIILGEKDGFYKIQSEPVLNSGRTAIDSASGVYNFNTMYAYASKDYITEVANNPTQWWSPGNVTTSAASPQLMNTEIKITANAQGETAGLEYKFVWMKDGWNSWNVIQDFSSASTASWCPSEGGQYTLYVDIRDSEGKQETLTVAYTIKNWGIDQLTASPGSCQAIGEKISLTTQTVGSTSALTYKYVWMKNGWNSWGVIRDFTSDKSAEWIPQEDGEYTFIVDVKDADGFTVSREIKYTVKERVWTCTGISFDKESPVELGSTVKISPVVENPNSTLQYKYVWMKDSWKSWGVIKEYSGETSVSWKPQSTGEYWIYVDVKDSKGNEEHYNVQYKVIQGEWKISNVTMSPDAFQKVGNKVKVSVGISGNSYGLEYKYVWMKDNWKSWGVIKDFSTEASVSWTPSTAGTYQIYVDVQDSSGEKKTLYKSYEVTEKAWKYSGISLNQTSPQEIGINVGISPTVEGDTTDLQYKYVWMKDNWKSWGVIKEFSSSGSAVWTPVEPGEYKIYVDVQEKTGSNMETRQISFTVVAGTWEIAGIGYDMESPQACFSEVGIAARIIGNTTGLQYKYVWMKDNWNSWGVIAQQSSNSKCVWTPAEAGRYSIYLDVFGVDGVTKTYVSTFTVNTWQIMTSPVSSSVLGGQVSVAVEGIIHNKNLEYKYVWMKDNWKSWGVIKDFSESRLVYWKPKEAGTYSIYVDIHNSMTDTTVSKVIQYTVSEK